MTFLELCQRAAVEFGVSSGQAITTALPTVVGASGSLARIVNWVNDAWTDLQSAHDDWSWMRSSYILRLSGTDPLGSATAGISFATVAGQATYSLGTGAGTVGVAVDSFGKWIPGTFRNFTTTTGFTDEVPMGDISFDRWRNGYMTNANRTVQTRPTVVAIGPDKSVCIGPPSNGLYTVTGDYYVAPTDMTLDDDTPTGLPTRFHMLIVWIAALDYAGYESAPEVDARAREKKASMYAQLQALYAPKIRTRGALA